MVADLNRENHSFSIGLGWGRLANNKNFSNPLNLISSKFERRIDYDYGLGGNLSFKRWFTGKPSIFGSYSTDSKIFKNLKYFIEYDSTNYEFLPKSLASINPSKREKKHDFNYGIIKSLSKNFDFGLGIINGNNISLNMNYKFNVSGANSSARGSLEVKKDSIYSKTQDSFFKNSLKRFNREGVFIQSIEVKNKSLIIYVSQDEYRNLKNLNLRSYEILSDDYYFDENFDLLTIVNTNNGLELSQISLSVDSYKFYAESNVDSLLLRDASITRDEDFLKGNKQFIPRLILPVNTFNIAPAIKSHIGTPDNFYLGGLYLDLKFNSIITRKLSIETLVSKKVYDDFNKKTSKPDSALPHVRTDIVEYLQQSNFFISRLQLDYVDSINKNIFFKLSGGILEDMYNGFGGEVIYMPFESNAAIGFELFDVVKRDFARRFKKLDYKTTTGHFNFYYNFNNLDIDLKISIGRYLAKDKGYTVDIARYFNSGAKFGAYFTRTNIPASLFGEGSFDKGLYFQIPFRLFQKNSGAFRDFNYSYKPLTRDGGQKVSVGKDLWGLLHLGRKDFLIRSF